MRLLLIMGALALVAAGCGPDDGPPPDTGPGFETIHILEFPEVRVGHSSTATARVRAGRKGVFLDPIEVEPPFLVDLTEVEKLEPGAERNVTFTFRPAEAGRWVQEVEIRSTGSARRYRLQAEALPAPEPCRPTPRVDRHEEVRPAHDLLIVLDDHRSMEAVRDVMLEQLGGLPDLFDDAGISWQIAVTTTGVGDGCLGGTLLGGGPIAPGDLEDVLQPPFCDGNGQGLVAATRALEQGFLRPQAGLTLVVVSTRDDHSPGSVADHTAAIRALLERPTQARSLMLVGDLNGECSLFAEPGRRYDEAVRILGGSRRSLCQASWGVAQFFSDLSTFGMPLRWELEGLPFDADGDGVIDPEAGEVVLRLDGAEIPARSESRRVTWSYDAAANAVVFEPAFAPTLGQTLEIDYETACPSASSVRSTSPGSL